MISTRNWGAGFPAMKLWRLLSVCAALSLSSVLVASPGCGLLCLFGIGDCGPGGCTADRDCTEEGKGMCLVDEEGKGTCFECLSDSDCSDGDNCTTDTCSEGNECSNVVVDCGDQLCDPSDGSCVDCLTDEDCDPGDVCNDNACALACTDASSCDDGTTCTTDTCDTATGQCSNEAVSCRDQICNPADGECVDCITDADCDAGEQCAGDNTCQEVVTGFNVTIDGCPTDTVTDGQAIELTANVSGQSADGKVIYTWTVGGSGTITGDDDADPAEVTFTSGTTPGRVNVSAEDNTVTPGSDTVLYDVVCSSDVHCALGDICNPFGFCETPGSDDILTPVGRPATATCDIAVVSEMLSVNAGIDREFIPGPAQDGSPFPASGIMAGTFAVAGDNSQTSSNTGHTIGDAMSPQTQLSCIATDASFPNSELEYFWSVVSHPPGVTVQLVDPGNSSTDLRILPGATFEGHQNVVAPGEYTFRCTGTNPAGFIASDQVTWTLEPDTIVLPCPGFGACRVLPNCYTPGSSLTVSIDINAPTNAPAVALADSPPAGWVVDVGSISHSGAWDPNFEKVKWAFTENLSRTVTYRVNPPSASSGTSCFSGDVRFASNDPEQITAGDRCITRCTPQGRPQGSARE